MVLKENQRNDVKSYNLIFISLDFKVSIPLPSFTQSFLSPYLISGTVLKVLEM